MAGDYVRLMVGMNTTLKFHTLKTHLNISDDELVAVLYLLAGWFRQHGKYGVMKHPASVVDSFSGKDGLAQALINVGWMHETEHGLILKGFTDVSGVRKGLGRAVRLRLFEKLGRKCQVCGSVEKLVIDHKVPVSRGGDSKESNLQILCTPCNVSKGTKTMEEWEAMK